jgi:hypothetical protein
MPPPEELVDIIILATQGRGLMPIGEILREVKRVSRSRGYLLDSIWQARVRDTLRTHCSDSPQYRGAGDFFINHGQGSWYCKVKSPQGDDD